MNNTVLDIIRANPGATGNVVYGELLKRSRVARWFGEDSFIAALFGPSFGRIFVALWGLEKNGYLRSEWGTAPRPGSARPRHYWTVD